ncbi:hypothetical protein CF392_15830 [Tamilnaduibacter salinus]|uniref:Uncharacterized protein n=1 Tax=Tamilnaduibacter salinus TaxID=1484056 RepID=A0A2A2HYQ7_9GAMM|nr:hypothetical protein CF392_15830 [Tamilnaduibacter salinus]
MSVQKFHGTAAGCFRLNEDYWAQVYVQLAASCVKIALVLWGVSSGWDIYGFLMAWALSEIVMHLGLTLLAFHRYRLRRGVSVFGYGGRLQARSWFRFMVWTNLAVAADLPAKELDVVLVGVLAGEREAGFYRIAKQGMALIGKLSSPLYQAIYPIQARALAGKDRSGAIRYNREGGVVVAACVCCTGAGRLAGSASGGAICAGWGVWCRVVNVSFCGCCEEPGQYLYNRALAVCGNGLCSCQSFDFVSCQFTNAGGILVICSRFWCLCGTFVSGGPGGDRFAYESTFYFKRRDALTWWACIL